MGAIFDDPPRKVKKIVEKYPDGVKNGRFSTHRVDSNQRIAASVAEFARIRLVLPHLNSCEFSYGRGQFPVSAGVR